MNMSIIKTKNQVNKSSSVIYKSLLFLILGFIPLFPQQFNLLADAVIEKDTVKWKIQYVMSKYNFDLEKKLKNATAEIVLDFFNKKKKEEKEKEEAEKLKKEKAAKKEDKK